MSHAVLGTLAAEDLAAITRVSEEFIQLVRAGDADGIARLYTPDAVVMPPHRPAVEGRAAIREWAASLPPITRFEFDIVTTDGRGDLAYVRGRYAMTLQTPDGPVDDNGKYIEIRRRQADGSWPLEADIFNSDKP